MCQISSNIYYQVLKIFGSILEVFKKYPYLDYSVSTIAFGNAANRIQPHWAPENPFQ